MWGFLVFGLLTCIMTFEQEEGKNKQRSNLVILYLIANRFNGNLALESDMESEKLWALDVGDSVFLLQNAGVLGSWALGQVTYLQLTSYNWILIHNDSLTFNYLHYPPFKRPLVYISHWGILSNKTSSFGSFS